MSRKLTEEEKRLWKEATANVRKQSKNSSHLQGGRLGGWLEDVDSSNVLTPASTLPTPTSISLTPTPALPLAGRGKNRDVAPLEQGHYAGVDAATVRRIKRGQMAVSARIDLHGMTQAEAYLALASFLTQCVAVHRRLVLVITGKGRRGIGQESGVLKAAIPTWLNHPDLRPHILAFDTAQPLHGGTGAFYILLRKSRV